MTDWEYLDKALNRISDKIERQKLSREQKTAEQILCEMGEINSDINYISLFGKILNVAK